MDTERTFPVIRQTVLDSTDPRRLPSSTDSGDPQEPLRVYSGPAGHPFCLIAATAGG
jgi:hypothetical protein